ncbi:MAG: hypothetical protein ACLSE4_09805 [Clostridium sp.]
MNRRYPSPVATVWAEEHRPGIAIKDGGAAQEQTQDDGGDGNHDIGSPISQGVRSCFSAPMFCAV